MLSALSAAPIADLNNTGGGLPGDVDPNWFVNGSECPAGAETCPPPGVGSEFGADMPTYVPFDAVIVPVGGPPSPWNTPSSWIVPAVKSDGRVDDAADPVAGTGNLDFGSNLTLYQTSFTLGSFDSVSLSGLWWADGRLNSSAAQGPGTVEIFGNAVPGCGIFLNDVCVYDVSTGGDVWSGGGTAFNIPFGTFGGLYVSGVNELKFVVRNANNETGLRVDFQSNVTDEETVIPEPATYALIGLGLAGLAVWRRRRA
jgi:hypothetical protein